MTDPNKTYDQNLREKITVTPIIPNNSTLANSNSKDTLLNNDSQCYNYSTKSQQKLDPN